MSNRTPTHLTAVLLPLGLVAAIFLGGCSATKTASGSGQLLFREPDAAIAALSEAAASEEEREWNALFGPDSLDLLRSGDDIADRGRIREIQALMRERMAFEVVDDETRIAVLGDDAWPFPIPLIRQGRYWRFDTETGRQEIENRRVGLNEIKTLATLHAVVDAQREYAAGRYAGRAGVFAARVISSEGKRDGLYWPTANGKPASPLGRLVAEATGEGYSAEGYLGENEAGPTPYHGYFYRLLLAQGSNAPGGAKSYVDTKGAMTRGFAMLAWPARYGSSGKMTFLVDEKGIVFQKDLGAETAATAAAVQSYDPDKTWSPTAD
ncbi:MAG: DUF2950 family protein [Candidatus Binatia bacterium]